MKKWLKEQLELFKDYWNRTSIFIIFVDLFLPLISTTIAVISAIYNHPTILVALLILVLAAHIFYAAKVNREYIRFDNLYLNDEVSLLNDITNIIQLRRLKNQGICNNVNVKDLNIYYNIKETSNPEEGKMDVKWVVNCKPTKKNSLIAYHILFSKERTENEPKLSAWVTLFGGKIVEGVFKKEKDNVVNHYSLTFNGITLGESQFELTILVNDYYKHIWNQYETFSINPMLWGKSVENLKMELTFESDKVADRQINAYTVNPKNLNRESRKSGSCTLVDGVLKFEHSENNISDFCLIVVDKQ